MPDFYVIANLCKRQYFSPWSLGDRHCPSKYLEGLHPVALAALTCIPPAVRSFSGEHPRVGSWSGDRVAALDEEMPPDVLGILSSHPLYPDRNLFILAHQEFEDISPDVMRFLADQDDRIVARVTQIFDRDTNLSSLNDPTLYCAAQAALSGSYSLRRLLEKRLGSNWVRLYEASRAEHEEVRRLELEPWV